VKCSGICVEPGTQALPLQTAAEGLVRVAFSCGVSLAAEGWEGMSDQSRTSLHWVDQRLRDQTCFGPYLWLVCIHVCEFLMVFQSCDRWGIGLQKILSFQQCSVPLLGGLYLTGNKCGKEINLALHCGIQQTLSFAVDCIKSCWQYPVCRMLLLISM